MQTTAVPTWLDGHDDHGDHDGHDDHGDHDGHDGRDDHDDHDQLAC